MKYRYKIVSLLLTLPVLVLIVQLFTASVGTVSDADKNYEKYFSQNYKIFSLNVPADVTFAGEAVPLHDLDIRERLDKEMLVNTYWQSQTLLFHKNANRWFPVMEKILKEHGVPEDFKYLALIESGLTNTVSPAGATGFWQFMEKTGLQFNLEINAEVDERYNVEKSTEAACKYLKQAYNKLGSWTLAAASYNMGIAGVSNQLKRQKATSYYQLLLNSETSRYVFRIMAVKEILNNSSKYGFHIRPKDLYAPYNTYEIEVSKPIDDLAEFAHQNKIGYRVLKVLNPWLRQSYLKNFKGKTYTIKLPKDGFDTSSSLTEDFERYESGLKEALEMTE